MRLVPENQRRLRALIEANYVKGLRAKSEVWCHTCWGNPFAQRLSERPSYRPALAHLDRLDIDVVTVEARDDGYRTIGGNEGDAVRETERRYTKLSFSERLKLQLENLKSGAKA